MYIHVGTYVHTWCYFDLNLNCRYLEDDIGVRVSMLTLLVELASSPGEGSQVFIRHFLSVFIRRILEEVINQS